MVSIIIFAAIIIVMLGASFLIKVKEDDKPIVHFLKMFIKAVLVIFSALVLYALLRSLLVG